ncbi:MAG: rRNA maturation RNase YbeY [Patescibacteria group bacterium]
MNLYPAVIIKIKFSTQQKQRIRLLVFQLFCAIPTQFRKKLPREIMVLFVSSLFSRALNRTYRKKDMTANVLSFIYDKNYAEIFIAPAVVRKEAKKCGESYAFYLAKMIIHGMIHCGGIDHEQSRKHEKKFEELEQMVLKSIEHSGGA